MRDLKSPETLSRAEIVVEATTHRPHPDLVVKGITSNAFVPFPEPQKVSQVRCPRCEGNDGRWFPVEDSWVCANDDCLSFFTRRSAFPSTFVASDDAMRGLGISDLHIKELRGKWEKSAETRAFLAEYAKKPDGNLVLSGTPGTGKSFCASYVLMKYFELNKSPGFLCIVKDFHEVFKAVGTFPEDYTKLHHRLMNVPLLILDDFGTSTPTDSFADTLLGIVNKRFERELPLVITTNLGGVAFRDRFGDVMAGRVFSGKLLKFKGPDRRTEGLRTFEAS